MRRFMFLILCVVLLAACGSPETNVSPTSAASVATNAAPSNTDDPCAPDALKAYRLKYNDVIDRWGNAALVAGQAKAADLQKPIDSLKQIVDELDSIKAPPCAKDAHVDTLDAMYMAIGGYEDLLAKKEVGTTIRTAIDKLALATARVQALPGTPVPAPTLLPSSTPIPTWTPGPTAEPTATPVPTATPEPRQAVIAGRTQMYETSTSTAPIKTLEKNTAVLVFETQKGRIHIQVEGVDGWVSPGSVIIK
jgi:hypothetical protein